MRQLLICLGNNVLFKVNICSKYQATKLTVLCKEGGKKKENFMSMSSQESNFVLT